MFEKGLTIPAMSEMLPTCVTIRDIPFDFVFLVYVDGGQLFGLSVMLRRIMQVKQESCVNAAQCVKLLVSLLGGQKGNTSFYMCKHETQKRKSLFWGGWVDR